MNPLSVATAAATYNSTHPRNQRNPRLKNSVVSKSFGNFVPNFRERVAKSKTYKLKTKQKRNHTHEPTN